MLKYVILCIKLKNKFMLDILVKVKDMWVFAF